MSKLRDSRRPALAAAVLVAAGAVAVPLRVSAAEAVRATCTAQVDVAGQTYLSTFTVTPATPFNEDFSTVTRQRTFSATIARDGNVPVVSFSYTNDVGVFDFVAFNGEVALQSNRAATHGGNSFSSSLGGSRGYDTVYSVSCTR